MPQSSWAFTFTDKISSVIRNSANSAFKSLLGGVDTSTNSEHTEQSCTKPKDMTEQDFDRYSRQEESNTSAEPGKRRRPPDSHSEGQNKRPKAMIAHEGRLVSNSFSHRGAQPLSTVAATDPKRGDSGRPRRRAVAGPTFLYVNTLDHPQPFRRGDNPAPLLPPVTEQTVVNTGIQRPNRQARAKAPDNRKLESHFRLAELDNDPIEIVKNDDAVRWDMSVEGGPKTPIDAPHFTKQGGTQLSLPGYFKNTECSNVRSLLSTSSIKKRKNSRGGAISSMTASESSGEIEVMSRGLARSAIEQPASASEIELGQRNPASQSKRTHDGSSLPRRNLYKEPHMAPSRQKDQHGEHGRENGLPTSWSATRQMTDLGAQHDVRDQNHEGRLRHAQPKLILLRETPKPWSKDIKGQDSQYQVQNTGTSQRGAMKPVSNASRLPARASPIEDYQESADELSAPSNATAPAILGRNPGHHRTPASNHDQSITGTAPSRATLTDTRKLKVLQFFCNTYIGSSVSLTLHYDESREMFQLHEHGRVGDTSSGECAVQFSLREVQKIQHAPNSNLVLITGPRTRICDGKRLIHFADYDGVSWLQSKLKQNVERLRVAEETSEKMAKIFGRQEEVIHQTFQKQKQKDMQSSSQQSGRDKEYTKDESYETERPTLEHSKGIKKTGLSVIDNHQARRKPYTSSRYFHEPEPHSNSPPQRVTRPTRLRKERQISPPSPEPWTRRNKLTPWSHSVVYPDSGPRRVTVDFNDLERLDEGEFLNDSVVQFALRQIEESMRPEHKEKVHFLNTFFYSALSMKDGRKGFNYAKVQRWTKNIDLFSVPYVVVPINIDLHWFVAIICNLPNLSRQASAADERPPPHETAAIFSNVNAASNPADAFTAETPKSNPTIEGENSQRLEKLSLFDVVEEGSIGFHQPHQPAHNGIDDVQQSKIKLAPLAETRASNKQGKRNAPPVRRIDPDQPSIITLDSFGNSHGAEIRLLKEYLKAEANDKRGMTVEIQQLQGVTAKGVPEQTNFCDCGVYLIGYIEQFAKDPQEFVTKVLKKDMDGTSFAGFNSTCKRVQLQEDLLELYREQEAERKAKRGMKKSTPVPSILTAGTAPFKEAESRRVQSSDKKLLLSPKIMENEVSPQPREQQMNGSDAKQGDRDEGGSSKDGEMLDDPFRDRAEERPVFDGSNGHRLLDGFQKAIDRNHADKLERSVVQQNGERPTSSDQFIEQMKQVAALEAPAPLDVAHHGGAEVNKVAIPCIADSQEEPGQDASVDSANR